MNKEEKEVARSMDDMSRIEPLPLKTKMEFSKKIIIATLAFTMIVIVFSMVFMWTTGDSSGMGYLLTGMFAQASAASSVYYVKSKKENEIKLQALYGHDRVQQAEQAIQQEQWNNPNNNYNDFI